MSPATKEWVKLISLAVGTGCAVTGSTYAGGCKLWVAILAGVGAAGMSVYHANQDSPSQKTQLQNPS